MEMLRKAALAFFDNSKDEIRNEVINFFQGMDKDGDGKISTTEFLKYVQDNIREQNPVMLSELVRDGSDVLYFDDIKVYFYLVRFRSCYCTACGNQIKEMYFTCCECFLSTDCVNICLPCYESKRHKHEHNNFIDNYAMLVRTRDQLMKQKNDRTYTELAQAYPSGASATVAPANQTYMGYGTGSAANQNYMGYGTRYPMAPNIGYGAGPANQSYYGSVNPVAINMGYQAGSANANQTYMAHGPRPGNHTSMGYGASNPMATTAAQMNQTYMGHVQTNPMAHTGGGRASQFASAVGTAVVVNQVASLFNSHPQPATSSEIGTGPSTDPAGVDFGSFF